MFHSIKTRSFGILLGLSLRGCDSPAVLSAQTPAAVHDRVIAPVPPTRRAPDASPDSPPASPAVAEKLRPLTLNAVLTATRAGRTQTLRQTITRTVDRIHVTSSDGREWLFERNPVDPSRVSAFLVQHGSQRIVSYQESDLRMSLGIRGWADVLWLGFDPILLNELVPTSQTRLLGGIRFVRHTADRERALTREVWLSEEQALASGFVVADRNGSTRFSIERIRSGINADRLRSPIERFPTYRVFHLTEWLERQ